MIRITDVVLTRGRPVVRDGCITRGLTRYRCLRRAGVDVALCFGVAQIDGEVASHCWVVADEHPLREPPDAAVFQEVFRIEAPGVIRAAA